MTATVAAGGNSTDRLWSWRRRYVVFSTYSSLESNSSGENLDLYVLGDGCHSYVAFLLRGVTLKTLITSMLIVRMDAYHIAVDRCPTSDVGVPRGGLHDNYIVARGQQTPLSTHKHFKLKS
jgi:hypothetical protein